MSLILTRPACPCPPTAAAQLCIDFLFTDGTPDQIPLVASFFLLIKNTLNITNFVSGFLGYIPATDTNGTPNNVPLVLCS